MNAAKGVDFFSKQSKNIDPVAKIFVSSREKPGWSWWAQNEFVPYVFCN